MDTMILSRPLIIFALLVTGCQVQGNASVAGSEDKVAERKPEPLAIPPEDPCLDAANADPEKCAEPAANIDQFIGGWKITRVYVNPEGVQAFVEDDKAIVGSIFSIAASEIKWTTKASAGFTSDDVCKLPLVTPPASEADDALSAALKRFAVEGGVRLRFGCGEGRWGPGEAGVGVSFVPVGANQMVLKWYDGATLLAERSNK
jgi:hypothetical protein